MSSPAFAFENPPVNPLVDKIAKTLSKKTLTGPTEMPLLPPEQRELCLAVFDFFWSENCNPLAPLRILNRHFATTMLSAEAVLTVKGYSQKVTVEELKVALAEFLDRDGESVAYKVKMLTRADKRYLNKTEEGFISVMERVAKEESYLLGMSGREREHTAEQQLQYFRETLENSLQNDINFKPLLMKYAEWVLGERKPGLYEICKVGKRKPNLYYIFDLMYRRAITNTYTLDLLMLVQREGGITRAEWREEAYIKCATPDDVEFEEWYPPKVNWLFREGMVKETDGRVYLTEWGERMLDRLQNRGNRTILFSSDWALGDGIVEKGEDGNLHLTESGRRVLEILRNLTTIGNVVEFPHQHRGQPVELRDTLKARLRTLPPEEQVEVIKDAIANLPEDRLKELLVFTRRLVKEKCSGEPSVSYHQKKKGNNFYWYSNRVVGGELITEYVGKDLPEEVRREAGKYSISHHRDSEDIECEGEKQDSYHRSKNVKGSGGPGR